MLDLATTPASPRPAATQLSSGRVYRPVAWDRPGKVAAAVASGEGGLVTEYVTWNGNAASPFGRASVPPVVIAFRVEASGDARLVMGPEATGNVLRVWPILDIGKAEQVRSAARISSAAWRPGPTAPYEVIWSVGRKVELFRYQTDFSMTLYTGSEDVAGVAVRPDGSGVLVMHTSGRLLVVNVLTQQTTDTSTVVEGLPPLPRGVVLR